MPSFDLDELFKSIDEEKQLPDIKYNNPNRGTWMAYWHILGV